LSGLVSTVGVVVVFGVLVVVAIALSSEASGIITNCWKFLVTCLQSQVSGWGELHIV
jgi:hypothetical protein